ncbi:MAG: choice-of-anchor J domain-containing protein [Bacteroidales bacterium]|nr:choice-of-anchor J domain-containing protein [Bacteroidales bacterium]
MRKNLLSLFTLAVLMLASAVSYAQTTYALIDSEAGLEVGAKYLLVGFDDDGNAYAMSYQKSNNRHAVNIAEDGGAITATVATAADSQTEPFEITLGGAAGAWTLSDELTGGYLYAPGTGNHLKTTTELDDKARWTITFDGDAANLEVNDASVEQRFMHFNLNASNNSPLFSCYKATSTITAPVYFFKAGGSVDPDPEPSNYPTNFTATVDKVEVTLNWTDATGAQLPSKYLVVGSTGSITVPTDGEPVADGALVKNVAYGVQTVTFGNLDGNTTYHFAIFPYTNSGSNIDYKTGSGYPTANAQTEDVHVLLNETFDSELGSFTAVDLYGEQDWHSGTYNNNSYAYMNGYASGAAHQNEDWLISPALDGDYATINMNFKTAKNYDGDDLKLMVSSDYDGQSEPSDFEWEELTDMFDWSTGSYAWVESGIVNIKSYVGSTFYIAFVYTSSDEAAPAWEVDDVMLVAAGPVSVAEQTAKTFAVSPNPANAVVRFELSQEAQVSVYDLSGRMVSETRMSAGAATVDVAKLENGLYFLSVAYADGNKAVARFVKF